MQGDERRRRRRLVSLKFLSQREVCPVLSLWGSDISKTPDGKFADKPKKSKKKTRNRKSQKAKQEKADKQTQKRKKSFFQVDVIWLGPSCTEHVSS